jgi:hypothetical protein
MLALEPDVSCQDISGYLSGAVRLAIVVALLSGVVFESAPALADTALIVIGDGTTAADLERVESEVRAGAGMSLQAADVTKSRLAGVVGRGSGCDLRSIDCLVQLGVVCGTEQLMLADVAQGEGARSIALTLVDVNAGKAKRRARGTSVADAIGALGRPAATTTRVSIAGPAGTQVEIDGNVAGKIPFTRTDVTPGPHTLRLTVPGKPAREQKLDVLLGEETKVSLDEGPPIVVAQPSAPPPAQESSILPVVGAVTGGVLIVAGGIVGGFGLNYYLQRDSAIAVLKQQETGAAQKLESDPTFRDQVIDARDVFETRDGEWEQFGVPLATTGTLLLGLGVGTAFASALWMTE